MDLVTSHTIVVSGIRLPFNSNFGKDYYYVNLTSNIMVVFILIKPAEAMIYTFLAFAPIGASKLSFF